jgi:hypothetical protein
MSALVLVAVRLRLAADLCTRRRALRSFATVSGGRERITADLIGAQDWQR